MTCAVMQALKVPQRWETARAGGPLLPAAGNRRRHHGHPVCLTVNPPRTLTYLTLTQLPQLTHSLTHSAPPEPRAYGPRQQESPHPGHLRLLAQRQDDPRPPPARHLPQHLYPAPGRLLQARDGVSERAPRPDGEDLPESLLTVLADCRQRMASSTGTAPRPSTSLPWPTPSLTSASTPSFPYALPGQLPPMTGASERDGLK